MRTPRRSTRSRRPSRLRSTTHGASAKTSWSASAGPGADPDPAGGAAVQQLLELGVRGLRAEVPAEQAEVLLPVAAVRAGVPDLEPDQRAGEAPEVLGPALEVVGDVLGLGGLGHRDVRAGRARAHVRAGRGTGLGAPDLLRAVTVLRHDVVQVLRLREGVPLGRLQR